MQHTATHCSILHHAADLWKGFEARIKLARWKFADASSLLNLLYAIVIELTFEMHIIQM